MIENKEQKLFRKIKELSEKNELLLKENLFLKEKIKYFSLSLQGGPNQTRPSDILLKGEEARPSECSIKIDKRENSPLGEILPFAFPNFLKDKISTEFLKDIMKTKKLDENTMNFSLEGISYDLKNGITGPKGSFDHFFNTMIKEKTGYISYYYLKHLDVLKSAEKTKTQLEEFESREKEIELDNQKLECYYQEFESIRSTNPESLKKFIPVYCIKGLFNYEKQGTPSYKDWVKNWKNNHV